MTCPHLRPLERAIAAAGIAETYRGQPWSHNCREWVYFDCVLDPHAIRDRFALPPCVVPHVNDDPRSGREAGFVCEECHDAVVGFHPGDGANRRVFPGTLA